jgi:hypothetical protein
MTPPHINTLPVVVEADAGSFSSLGRPPERAWLVRLRQADRSVVVAIGLSRTAADHLAAHINELINTQPVQHARTIA